MADEEHLYMCRAAVRFRAMRESVLDKSAPSLVAARINEFRKAASPRRFLFELDASRLISDTPHRLDQNFQLKAALFNYTASQLLSVEHLEADALALVEAVERSIFENNLDGHANFVTHAESLARNAIATDDADKLREFVHSLMGPHAAEWVGELHACIDGDSFVEHVQDAVATVTRPVSSTKELSKCVERTDLDAYIESRFAETRPALARRDVRRDLRQQGYGEGMEAGKRGRFIAAFVFFVSAVASAAVVAAAKYVDVSIREALGSPDQVQVEQGTTVLGGATRDWLLHAIQKGQLKEFIRPYGDKYRLADDVENEGGGSRGVTLSIVELLEEGRMREASDAAGALTERRVGSSSWTYVTSSLIRFIALSFAQEECFQTGKNELPLAVDRLHALQSSYGDGGPDARTSANEVYRYVDARLP